MVSDSPLTLVRSHMTLRTTGALVQTVTDLISSGALPPGERLPTIREVAAACGMSRSSVGDGWRELGARGLIETRRRGGTIVIGKPATPRAVRYESMIRSTAFDVRDLANIRTDDLPYPDLTPALAWATRQPQLHNPFVPPITTELENAIRQVWTFSPERLVAMHGLMDGAELLLSLVVKAGDTVVVESPSHGRILDVLEALGARTIGVEYGPDGPDLAALQRALISKPAAFIYQPSGQLPSGRSVSPDWIERAAATLEGTLPIIELSHLSLLYPQHPSLGPRLPSQVTQIRSFNLFFGADMRISIVGGSAGLIDAMWMKLTYSTRFVSRLLQGALAFLLTDANSQRALSTLTTELRDRHRRLTDAIRRRGLDVYETPGPCIWLPVPDEYSVCTRLSRFGIAVHPGALFLPTGDSRSHILLNSAAVNEDYEQIAALIASACAPFSTMRARE